MYIKKPTANNWHKHASILTCCVAVPWLALYVMWPLPCRDCSAYLCNEGLLF